MRNNNSLIKTKFFLAILIMLILIGIVFTVCYMNLRGLPMQIVITKT